MQIRIRPLVRPGLLFAALFFTVRGTGLEGPSKMDGLFGFDLPSIFGVKVAYPVLALLVLGYIIGNWLVPLIQEIFVREKRYDRFLDDWQQYELGKWKTEFFKYLSRAYVVWSKAHPNPYNTFDEFVDSALYPDWLPVKRGDLGKEADARLATNPSPHWQFAFDLYREVDGYIKRRGLTVLLPEDEAEEFHDIRQKISYFWENTGRAVFKTRQLRYHAIRHALASDDRVIKFMPYLSVALHRLNKQKGAGSQYMYRLGARHFGTEKRRWIVWDD